MSTPARGGEIRTLGGLKQLSPKAIGHQDCPTRGSTSYQQKPVESPNNPRINTPALTELFTHKHSRFGLKARINSPAFTHKHSRLCGSSLRDYWSVATPPVVISYISYSYSKNKAYIGSAKKADNS